MRWVRLGPGPALPSPLPRGRAEPLACLRADSRPRPRPECGAVPGGASLNGPRALGLGGGRGPCGQCPLCLRRWRYCYCAATNDEFCSQSTDVSSRQKSEPNTLIVSR